MKSWVVIVPGIAQPQGSTRSFVNRKTGKVATTSTNPKVRPWRQAIAWEAKAAGVKLMQGPVWVDIVVLLPRPRSHFGKRGLRPSAPIYPITKPDKDKLERAVLDALTGVAYRDDAQVVGGKTEKFYCSEAAGDSPLAHIIITGEDDA